MVDNRADTEQDGAEKGDAEQDGAEQGDAEQKRGNTDKAGGENSIESRRASFIGRTEEMERLDRELSRAFSGKGRIVGLKGEAGVGKTRLIEEYLAKKKRPLVLAGSAEKGDQPYQPFVQIFTELFRSRRAMSGDERKEKLCGMATEIEEMLKVEILPEDYQRPDRASTTYAVSAKRGRSELLDIAANVIVEASQAVPMILFIDNFQWADISSAKLFKHIGDSIENQPVLLMLAYRESEVVREEGEEEQVGQVLESLQFGGAPFLEFELEPLDPLEILEMVESLLDVKDMPTLFIKKLYKETGGNPLFVEGVIHTILEGKKVDLSDKHWYVKIDLSSLNLPKNMYNIMESKISKLDQGSTRLLHHSAVIGQTFDVNVLECAVDTEPEDFEPSLKRLERANLIKKGMDVGEYKFVHPDVRDMVYSQLGGEKKDIHRSVGGCLEKMADDDFSESLYEIAKHFTICEDPEKAFKYNNLAGDRAKASYAPEDAVKYYASAVKFCEEREGKDAKEALADLQMKMGDVYRDIGKWDLAMESFKVGLSLYRQLEDNIMEAEANRHIGDIHRWRSDWEAARSSYEAALKLLEGHKDQGHRAIARSLRGLGYVLWRKGEPDRAIKLYETSIRHAERIKDIPLMGAILIEFGNVYNDKGELEKALRYYKKSLEVLPKVKNYVDLARAYNNIGDIYLQIGQWKKAVEFFKKCGQVSEKVGNRNMMAWALFNAGEALAKDGETSKALSYCDGAMKILEELNDKMGISAVYKDYGIIYRFKEEWDRSIENFEKSMEIQEELASPYSLAETLYEFGMMYKDKGDQKMADDCFHRASEIVDEIGAKGLAKKLERAGAVE